MPGLEIFGVILVAFAIVYSFYKKKDRTALALVITLLLCYTFLVI